MQNGADLKVELKKGFNLLMAAATSGENDLIKYLIETDLFDPFKKFDSGNKLTTALGVCQKKGNKKGS